MEDLRQNKTQKEKKPGMDKNIEDLEKDQIEFKGFFFSVFLLCDLFLKNCFSLWSKWQEIKFFDAETNT